MAILRYKGKVRKDKTNSDALYKKAKTSRKFYLPVYSMIVILICILVFLWYKGYELNKWAIILSVVFILVSIKSIEVHRYLNYTELSAHSLVHVTGIFHRNVQRLEYASMSDIEVNQTLWQRFLKYGDILIRVFSRDSAIIIKNVNKPKKLADSIEFMVSQKRR